MFPKTIFDRDERRQVLENMVDILYSSVTLRTSDSRWLSSRPKVFPFLSLPRELRQMILFHVITDALEEIDKEIEGEAMKACQCYKFICGPSRPVCRTMEAQATALGYKRVRKMAEWIKEVGKGNREVQDDFENGYTSWVVQMGGVNEGGKAAKMAKGKKAFVLWIFETAGCAKTVDLLNATYE